jgi:hypothetical protein
MGRTGNGENMKEMKDMLAGQKIGDVNVGLTIDSRLLG